MLHEMEEQMMKSLRNDLSEVCLSASKSTLKNVI